MTRAGSRQSHQVLGVRLAEDRRATRALSWRVVAMRERWRE
jgi:hypothetical protein